jgi:glyoxylase-like metal-dependent hydrolase (beta-lactamase superfamily II)
VRVHPISTGTAMYPVDAFFRRGGRMAGLRATGIRGEAMEIPIPMYLIEHPGAGLVLVDTGLHSSVAVAPGASLGPMLGRFAAWRKIIRMGPGDGAPDQLRERGFDPAQVRTVVMTHLHIDHASGMSQFPDATFVMSRREWEAASTGGIKEGYIQRQFDHAFDYRLLDFDGQDVSSFASFGRSLDLFGDGSLHLLFTPGHTLGHMSVAARLRDGEILIVADAAYTMRTIEQGEMPFGAHDEHDFRRSLKAVEQYIQQTPGAVVVPGHDMDVWRTLKPVYE